MIKQPEFPPGWRVSDPSGAVVQQSAASPEHGWRVTDPSGEIVQQSDGPTAAELNAVSDTEKGGEDGSDRAASGE
jgi:hypothetical protein